MSGALLVIFAAFSSPAVAVAGCGHRATQADCQLIVDKAVELQMKEMDLHDAPTIEKREQDVRAELGGEIKSCEGRHVTDRTLACVRAATTTVALDGCLR
ncbi:MAG: hypothetical protein ACRENE_31200 [Polyangiaceae bacterium]